MALPELVRWATVRVAAFPWFWIWAAVLSGFGPLVRSFLPLGLTTRGEAGSALVYEIAFLAILAGSVAGMRVLEEAPYVLEKLDALRRLVAESTVITTATACFLLFGLFSIAWIGEPWSRATYLGLARATLLSHLHVVAVSILALRLPLRRPARQLLVPVAVWVVPAVLAQQSGWIAHLVGLLDAGRHLSYPSNALEKWGVLAATGASLRPIVALVLAAALLRPPPLPHALRHPR